MKKDHTLLTIEAQSPTVSAENLLQLNLETAKYGLTLTHAQAMKIIDHQANTLWETKRVEFTGDTVAKIISAFKTSGYIHQHDYEETICQLVDTFYYYKNETRDEIDDDRLIELMQDRFENSCRGSLELLHHKAMDEIVTNLRRGIDYNDTEEYDIEQY